TTCSTGRARSHVAARDHNRAPLNLPESDDRGRRTKLFQHGSVRTTVASRTRQDPTLTKTTGIKKLFDPFPDGELPIRVLLVDSLWPSHLIGEQPSLLEFLELRCPRHE